MEKPLYIDSFIPCKRELLTEYNIGDNCIIVITKVNIKWNQIGNMQ